MGDALEVELGSITRYFIGVNLCPLNTEDGPTPESLAIGEFIPVVARLGSPQSRIAYDVWRSLIASVNIVAGGGAISWEW